MPRLATAWRRMCPSARHQRQCNRQQSAHDGRRTRFGPTPSTSARWAAVLPGNHKPQGHERCRRRLRGRSRRTAKPPIRSGCPCQADSRSGQWSTRRRACQPPCDECLGSVEVARHTVEGAEPDRPSLRRRDRQGRSRRAHRIDRRPTPSTSRKIGADPIRAIDEQACRINRVKSAVEVDEPGHKRDRAVFLASLASDPGFEQPHSGNRLEVVDGLDVTHPRAELLAVEAEDLGVGAPALQTKLVTGQGCRELKFIEDRNPDQIRAGPIRHRAFPGRRRRASASSPSMPPGQEEG